MYNRLVYVSGLSNNRFRSHILLATQKMCLLKSLAYISGFSNNVWVAHFIGYLINVSVEELGSHFRV